MLKQLHIMEVTTAYIGDFCDPLCQNNGTCVLSKCLCPEGYTGITCQDIIEEYSSFSSLAAIIGGVSFIAIMVILSCLAFVSLLKKPQDDVFDHRGHDSRLVSVAAIDPCPSVNEEEMIAQSDIPPRYSQVTISLPDRLRIAKTFQSIETFKVQSGTVPPTYDMVEQDESAPEDGEEYDKFLVHEQDSKYTNKES
ncbi:uncharacterized protein [Antedon mediterranea]|uniref:uncharacterized protein n=1 Tax=Antedon mediterranea TaxID=105859 RepID=UPI003AF47781